MLPPELTDPIRRAGADCFRGVLGAVSRHFGADMGMIHRLNPADAHLDLVATSDGPS